MFEFSLALDNLTKSVTFLLIFFDFILLKLGILVVKSKLDLKLDKTFPILISLLP